MIWLQGCCSETETVFLCKYEGRQFWLLGGGEKIPIVFQEKSAGIEKQQSGETKYIWDSAVKDCYNNLEREKKVQPLILCQPRNLPQVNGYEPQNVRFCLRAKANEHIQPARLNR